MFSMNTKKAMAKAVLTKESPFYVQFYVSKYCHLNCRMCNIVQSNAGVELADIHQIEKIADNLVEIGAGVVVLTGGEPFLRPNIDEIVKIFKQHKLDVRMQTAGLLGQNDLMRRCVENGARDISVSLDTLDGRVGDFINGKSGSWERALKQIAFISNHFPAKDSVCALGCVLSKYNINEVDAMLDFATEIGWWLSLVPVHIAGEEQAAVFRGHQKNMKFHEEDFEKAAILIERLKRKKRQGYLLFDSDKYLDSVYYFITSGRTNWRHKGVCDSPNLYFTILPDGRFAPCNDYRFTEDIRVYDPQFPSVFRSEGFREKVHKIAKACPGCNYGCFPEMTLSARSLQTQIERGILQIKTKRTGMKPVSEEEIFMIVERVKAAHPKVYRNGERIGWR